MRVMSEPDVSKSVRRYLENYAVKGTFVWVWGYNLT